MRPLTHRLAIASLVGVAGLALGVIPAAADTPGASFDSTPASTAPVTPLVLPNVNIGQKTGFPPAYHPHALTVAPKGYTTCTAARAVFTVSNRTTATQTMTQAGKVFATIPTKEGVDVCAKGPAGATAVFGLKGSKSKLTITLS